MKFASCPEQEVPAPDQLPALLRRNSSVRSPLASRQWRPRLTGYQLNPCNLIFVTTGLVPNATRLSTKELANLFRIPEISS